MKRSSLAALLSVLAVFACGVLVGALANRLYMVKSVAADQPRRETPEEWRRKYVSELSSRLKLDQNQTAEVNKILDETRDEYRALRDKHRPEVEAIHQRQVQRVSALLRPDQKAEYDKFRAERDAARRQAEQHHKHQ